MKTQQLSEDIQELVKHIDGWESLLSDEVAIILQKLWDSEDLSRSELNLDVTPSEVAAIWSVTNKTAIDPAYVRQVKRNGRIEPSKEWGKGAAYRCLYRVRGVKDI